MQHIFQNTMPENGRPHNDYLKPLLTPAFPGGIYPDSTHILSGRGSLRAYPSDWEFLPASTE